MRRSILRLMTVVMLALTTSQSHADTVDPAITNNDLIVLDLSTKYGSGEVKALIDENALRAKLVAFIDSSFRQAGKYIDVRDRHSDLAAISKISALKTLYVTVRIDIDAVTTPDGGNAIAGAVGVFFQKEGMVAHQSTQPLTIFVCENQRDVVELRAREAAQIQLIQSVVDPIALWRR